MAAKPPAAPLALDANSNSTAPTLPTVPKASKPVEPDPLVQMFPKNIPHWFVITYTYSVVLIVILLIANSTPDGKLYIHFTAFWSLVIYFTLEDEQVSQVTSADPFSRLRTCWTPWWRGTSSRSEGLPECCM